MATIEDTDEGRVVQTTLEESEYKEFRRLAERDDISVEEALDRAIRAYVVQRQHVLPTDPIFDVGDEEPSSVDEPTDARDLDAYLYGESVEQR